MTKCNKRSIIEPLLILMAPFTPHICEELWHKLGNETSVTLAQWPDFDASVLVENTFNYPVSFNGKMRYMLELPLDIKPEDVEKAVRENENSQKWLDGKSVKKVVFVCL